MLSAGDVYEIAIKQTFQGSEVNNIYHVALEAPMTSPQAAWQAFAQDAKEALRGAQHGSLVYAGWTARQVSGAGVTYSPTTCRRSGGDVYEGVFTGTLTGGDSVTAAGPSFHAMVNTLKTGFAGRSRRGRIMAGGFPIGHVAINTWQSGAVATVQAGMNTLLAAYGAAATNPQVRWVVWSKQIASGCKASAQHPHNLVSFATPDPANSFKSVSSVTTKALIAPMHRRKQGVGS